MRIVIDMQGAQSASRFRGIGRYASSLALAIARNAGKHEIWLVLNVAFPESIIDIRKAFKGLIPQEHIRVFEVPLPTEQVDPTNEARAQIAETIREYFLEQLNPDIILITSLFEGFDDNTIISVGPFSKLKTAVILYDLIPYIMKDAYLKNNLYKDYYLKKIDYLKTTNLLLSISDSSKKEAIEHLNIGAHSIKNISAAIENSFSSVSFIDDGKNNFLHRYKITKKTILYAPGGFDPRKNFENLIKAFFGLSEKLRKQYQLVIVSKIQEGSRIHLESIAKNAGLQKDDLILTGYVSDDDLKKFYSTCELFVFPSLHEGFGLPVLEAMACGAAVIGSNTTSVPEVIGLAKALFDPYSIESMSQKMEEVLSNEAFRLELKEHALIQTKKFSWDESAKKAIYAMEKCVTDAIDTPLHKNDFIKHISSILIHYNMTSEYDMFQVSSAIAFNQQNTKKQLLLDISEIVKSDAKSGIQRVVRSLLSEIYKKNFQDYEVKAIYFNGETYKYALSFTNKFFDTHSSQKEDEQVLFRQDDIYLSLDLNAHLTKVVHDLHYRLKNVIGMEVYFIVYDILLFQHPEWWVKGISDVFENWLNSISEVSTGLFCISQAVADEVTEWIKTNRPNQKVLPKIESFHLGADIDNSIPSKGLEKNSKIVLNEIQRRTTFLMVGTIEPRKGHNQTLEAFEKLWTNGIDSNLVIVGKEGWLVDTLIVKIKNHPELNKRLFWLDNISDEYLEKVYENATCLIAASEGEGFGLPLIEAAQHKIPIIARDIPVFREVACEFAYYFRNDKSAGILADTLKKWLELYKENKHPQSTKMPWLTWEESSEQLIKIIIS